MIDVNKITSGSMNGQYVWIYDFRYNSFNDKPIRKVLPQKVLIRCNSECNKKIYYSKSHFVGLNKKGEPLKSKIIPVFDNTGFRSRTGEPVNAFENKKECLCAYRKTMNELIGQAKEWQDQEWRRSCDLINELLDLFEI